MADRTSSIKQLAELLNSSSAKPIVSPDPIAPSSYYDLQYRIALVALAVEVHGSQAANGAVKLHSGKLKLFQFAAARPWLLPFISQWSSSQKEGTNLEDFFSFRFRRGFLTDSMHDRVIRYLAATGALSVFGNQIEVPANSSIRAQAKKITEEGLFKEELGALRALADLKITNYMVEGW